MANSDAYLIGKAKYKDHDERNQDNMKSYLGKG